MTNRKDGAENSKRECRLQQIPALRRQAYRFRLVLRRKGRPVVGNTLVPGHPIAAGHVQHYEESYCVPAVRTRLRVDAKENYVQNRRPADEDHGSERHHHTEQAGQRVRHQRRTHLRQRQQLPRSLRNNHDHPPVDQDRDALTPPPAAAGQRPQVRALPQRPGVAVRVGGDQRLWTDGPSEPLLWRILLHPMHL